MSEEEILDLIAASRFTWTVWTESYAKPGEALIDIQVTGDEIARRVVERSLRGERTIGLGSPNSRMPGSTIFYTIYRSNLNAVEARRILSELLGCPSTWEPR